ncbi:MAG: DMT family transporter [Alphaproteobacteria bacterium]|nr:DMT family transporter [Alphaproteobacteria bacterium]
MASAADNRRGVLAMLLSAAVVTSSDMFIRAVTFIFPTGEVLATRGLVVMALIGTATAILVPAPLLRLAFQPFVLLRALCEAVMVVLFVMALPHMIFADVTAVFLSSSLLSAALVAGIGFERVGAARWAILLIGFGGVAMVVRPTFEQVNIGAVYALASASMIAVRDLVTRKIDPATPTILITMVTATTVTLLGFALMPFEARWRLPAAHEAGMFLAAGVLVAGANLLGVVAYRRADISVVAPFRYTALPFAIVASFIVWGEMPDFWSILGGATIAAASIAAIWMQRARR